MKKQTKKSRTKQTTNTAISDSGMLADGGGNQAMNSNSSTEGKNSKKRSVGGLDLNEINSGNKLIAEFMGAEPDDKYPTLYFIEPHLNHNETHDFYIGNMRYHTSWDWLMPVVEKICRVKIGDGIETILYAYPRTFGMLNEKGEIMVRFNGFFLHESNSLIDATWKGVVEFIKYINSANYPKRQKDGIRY